MVPMRLIICVLNINVMKRLLFLSVVVLTFSVVTVEAQYNTGSDDLNRNLAKIDAEASRKEHRVTCGASIVIKNVLPFLALK